MSLAGLMNQTITLYNQASYDAYGRETVGSGTSVKSRFQKTTKRKLEATGNLITIDAVAYVPADTSVNTDDRVTYGTDKYKVYGKYEAVDGAGNTHHIKLELLKWRE
jgi:hypothetical protein